MSSKKHAKGTRKSKGKRAQTPWMKKVMECYHRMKKQNPNTKLGDAMKQAKKEM
uniref:HMG box domain-containing protein n=1 Tax=viral metagenome TaxID=1070528 RepID=A0A6C0JZP5_9ZZZZ